MVWIKCHDNLLTPFHEGPHQRLFSQEKNLNSASKVANWIIVDILKDVNTGKLIASHFLKLEMVIAKGH